MAPYTNTGQRFPRATKLRMVLQLQLDLNKWRTLYAPGWTVPPSDRYQHLSRAVELLGQVADELTYIKS